LPCFNPSQFLARDSIALYAIARPSVCASVRPSVTRVDQSKTVAGTIMQLSPQSSPMTLVSSLLTSPRTRKFQREHKSPYLRNAAR